MKNVLKIQDLPTIEHFAVLVFKEGSTCSPSYDKANEYDWERYNFVEYLSFDNKAELLDWIEENELRTNSTKLSYKIISSKPINLKKTITLDLD